MKKSNLKYFDKVYKQNDSDGLLNLGDLYMNRFGDMQDRFSYL